MHQYLMEALINPHFKHLKVTLSQSSCFLHLGQGTQIHSVLTDSLCRLHNAMPNMKNVCHSHDICIHA